MCQTLASNVGAAFGAVVVVFKKEEQIGQWLVVVDVVPKGGQAAEEVAGQLVSLLKPPIMAALCGPAASSDG